MMRILSLQGKLRKILVKDYISSFLIHYNISFDPSKYQVQFFFFFFFFFFYPDRLDLPVYIRVIDKGLFWI
jgi:hypothetical protein